MANVKRIFFEEGANVPSFELETGEIKKPMFSADGYFKWFTKDEHEKYLEKIKNEKFNLFKWIFKS